MSMLMQSIDVIPGKHQYQTKLAHKHINVPNKDCLHTGIQTGRLRH